MLYARGKYNYYIAELPQVPHRAYYLASKPDPGVEPWSLGYEARN